MSFVIRRYWETIITIILSILSVVQTITGILITILYSPLIAHSILYFVLCTLKKRVSLVIGHLFTRHSETKAGVPKGRMWMFLFLFLTSLKSEIPNIPLSPSATLDDGGTG